MPPAAVRVITWNVNGIRARFPEVVELCRREQPDVLCLQEIKATAAQVPEPLTGLPDYHSVWHGGPRGYSGVSLHVRRATCAAVPSCSPTAFDVEFRALELALGPVRILSVYVPNGNRDLPTKMTFLRALVAHAAAARAAGNRLLVCGDLNVARTDMDVYEPMRNPRAIGQLGEERALLEAIIDSDLVDLLRAFDPDNAGLFTWWPPWRDERRKNHGWRLDYILASRSLAASSCRVLADVGTSDHAPVAAEFTVDLS
jgi:exodeoxyribonuclease-3